MNRKDQFIHQFNIANPDDEISETDYESNLTWLFEEIENLIPNDWIIQRDGISSEHDIYTNIWGLNVDCNLSADFTDEPENDYQNKDVKIVVKIGEPKLNYSKEFTEYLNK